MKASSKQLEQMRARNAWANINPFKTQNTQASVELIKKVRFRCLSNGGNLGYNLDVKKAMLEISWEEPELQRTYFHHDYLARLASSWAYNWRRAKEEYKERILAEFNDKWR